MVSLSRSKCAPLSWLAKALWERELSTMTIERPAMMALTKKKMKMYCEYQSGWSFVGARRKSDPSADWCIVEKMTDSTVRATRAFFMTAWSRFQPSHSKSGTVNSRARTDE